MSRIVNGEKTEKHIIKSYTFKLLDNENNEEFETFSQSQKEEIVVNNQPLEEKNNNSELIENLLKKIEELSNNFVKTQMDFEKSINECHKKAAEEIQKSFEEGYKKGFDEAKQKCIEELNDTKKLYEDSIKKLDEINIIFEHELKKLEKELVSVALDIAKEVIQKEISENSKEIALHLSKSLMEDLKNASKVVIKVNPDDSKYLEEKLKGVKVIADKAVKKGGIVIMSDVGNIDGSIEERFNAVKEAVRRN